MRIACIIVDRANLRLLPVLRAIKAEPRLELQIICGGSMVLDRFDESGPPTQVLRAEGFEIDAEVFHEVEGCRHYTMALSCGEGVRGYADALRRLQPDMVLCIGDRYELLGAVAAAHLMNVPILHFQGGEASGCVDDRTRHAITMLSSWHVPATQQAAERVCQMIGRNDTILAIGCPSADLAAISPDDDEEGKPTGPLLCMMHPTTDEDLDERGQMDAVLKSLAAVPHGAEVFWPNVDPRSDQIHKSIRTFLKKPKDWLSTFKNLPPQEYLRKLANTRCAVGNSSSFCRDSVVFGTPVVLVGNRQRGRETGENVLHVPCESSAIIEAVKFQLDHGRYPPSELFGDGRVSERVVARLCQMDAGVEIDCLRGLA